MFGIGTSELLLILLVVLLLFGGKRLPEVARSLGKGLADFRQAMNEVQRQVDTEILKTPMPDRRGPAPVATALPGKTEGPGPASTGAELPGKIEGPSPAPAAGLEAPRDRAGDENRSG